MIEKILYGTEASTANFQNIVPNRLKKFEEASDAPIEKEPNVNKLARLLHPKQQFFIISEVTENIAGVKTYKLVPKNPENKPAYFNAGQYLSVKLRIDNGFISRPYSISSSPKEALQGFYTLTIKNTQDGFASKYIYSNWHVGTEVETSGPEGQFCYQQLRDADTVIGIAGGSGITPFYSMAKDIASGNADFKLVILFGCRCEEDILFKNELLRLEKESNGKIRVVFVLSDEKKSGYENGFISKDIIKKYAPETYSVFICGPQAMYNFVSKELVSMNMKAKFIRRELFGQIRDVYRLKGYPQQFKNTVFKLTLKIHGEIKSLPIQSNDSILVCMEKHGLKTWSCCRSGECGQCRVRIIAGDFYTVPEASGIRMADKVHRIVHSCITYPLSDIECELL